MLKARIEEDFKTALKARDAQRVSVLRMIKSAITYAEVDQREGMSEDDLLQVLRRQAKQRQDSADAYEKAGDLERRDAERAEKALIEEYLSKQMSDAELAREAEAVIAANGPLSPQNLGKMIGAVKQQVGDRAEGGRVAAYVKQRLQKEIDQ